MATGIAEIKTETGKIWVTRFSRGTGKGIGYQFTIELHGGHCVYVDCTRDELMEFLAVIIGKEFDFTKILNILNTRRVK